MKRYNIIGLTFLLILIFSCKKQDLPHKPQPSPFSVTVNGQSTIPATGTQIVVDIKAGADGWWIVIPAEAKSWCTASKIYGSGDKSITLKFSENNTSAGRSVTVEFNPTFNLPKEVITFQQD